MLTTDHIRSIVDAACCGVAFGRRLPLITLPHFFGPSTTAILVDEPIDGGQTIIMCAMYPLLNNGTQLAEPTQPLSYNVFGVHASNRQPVM